MDRWQSRRSKRLHLQVRVRVFGHRRDKGSFREDTATLSVNANGTLVMLSNHVELGQTVVVRHRLTGEDQECRVAFVGQVSEGKAKVGLAFTHPAPHFWQIDFPRAEPSRYHAPVRVASATRHR